MNWPKSLRNKIKFSELLKNHTTFKIGGPAKLFIEPKDTADLKSLLNCLKRYKIPYFVIGKGSNILVSDKGIKRAVLRLNSPPFKEIVFKRNYLEAGSGALLNNVISQAWKYGLSGLEFLVGIPGTIGGALVMNAGIRKRNIQDLVESIRVMDASGKIKILPKKKIKFSYRRSNLGKYIVLSACLKLSPKNKREIKDKMDEYLKFRKATQDLGRPSAGCVFKNPGGDSAGRLIDLCGLKSKQVGGAYISGRHANFILNKGNAGSSDVLRLMELAKREVKKKFDVTLKPEIKIWQ